ncbi:hypothetical protein HPB50_010709 [Hyalomma asiaticum]|uniref:Uncharacterized protein n=1 Tax=Hyalomma asiaticum TaxID=266040 RepID=A0ACB7SGT3_HYAAI|nr:hypothetical protein HPB50_010709 [Hyalomma asiaticum]
MEGERLTRTAADRGVEEHIPAKSGSARCAATRVMDARLSAGPPSGRDKGARLLRCLGVSQCGIDAPDGFRVACELRPAGRRARRRVCAGERTADARYGGNDASHYGSA